MTWQVTRDGQSTFGQGVIGIPVTRDALLNLCDWQMDHL
jgi:hypothetical protein